MGFRPRGRGTLGSLCSATSSLAPPTRPGDEDKGVCGCSPLCLHPPGAWGGSPPSLGTPALDLAPLGRPLSSTRFVPLDDSLFSFSPPEKLKHHKIIFVVGKLVSGSCCWWGQGHGTALSPRAPRVGGLRGAAGAQALWGRRGSSPAPRGHGGVCWDHWPGMGWQRLR